MDIHDHLYERVAEEQPFLCEIWEPQGVAVVIGHGQTAEREAHLAACRKDGVEVIRRRGGGGAVVLMPGVICLSCAFISRQSDSPYHFFRQINLFLIGLLEQQFNVEGLNLAGVSDIALGGCKILGCSMFKSRALYFYQGSLLINPDLARIGRYLAHPSREPDYRLQRGHDEFVTSLWRRGYPIAQIELAQALEADRPALQARLMEPV
jgi:lipoate---protein ligase